MFGSIGIDIWVKSHHVFCCFHGRPYVHQHYMDALRACGLTDFQAHGTFCYGQQVFFSKVSQSQYGKLWEVGFETCWVLNVHDPKTYPNQYVCFPHLVKSEKIIEFTMVWHMFVHGFCWLVGGESYHAQWHSRYQENHSEGSTGHCAFRC